jgi:putative DNA primase/helicase
MSNAQEMFRVAMTTAGIEHTGQIYADGELHRFKADGDHERNSWYVLNQGPPAAGAFGCWKRDVKEKWCERNGSLSQAELQRARQQWDDAESKLKTETAARQKKARKLAAWILSRSRPARTLHRYLSRKCVKIFGDVREYRGALVLPLRDLNGDLQSLQLIREDGSKKFLTGGRVAGCFFTLADRADGPVALCEGYATGASIHEATGYPVVCATHCGNLLAVAKAIREMWPQREIIVAADDDAFTDGNPGQTKATAAAKAIRAKLAVPRSGKVIGAIDFNELATVEGLAAVVREINAAEIPSETDNGAFARLAALSPADYDRCRETEAAALGIRVTTLDAEVERLRRWTGGNDSTLKGCAIDLPEIELLPHPVDGGKILDAIAKRHRAYIALAEYAADICALWEAHCHCFDVFDITPRLNITSPEKGCGKTTLLDVIALHVPRPLRTENLTAPVLFRLIEARKPTVLADEYDSWLKDNEELRGLFNAGHRRGGQALRCEGDNHEVKAFRVFGPAVLCGIGALPGTLHDRSIVIRLERAKCGEIKERFNSRRTHYEQELCRKLARWCSDNRAQLESCDPKMPHGAFNRLADNWRPLFAIAEIVGGEWPKRIAVAFDKVIRPEDGERQGIGVMLLTDIQQILTGMWPPPPEAESPSPVERIFSKELVETLCEMEDRPWNEVKRGKPITQNWLARQLGRFGIYPKTLRIGEGRAKGYQQADFADAFDRYLSDQVGQVKRDTVTCEGKGGFGPVTSDADVTDGKTPATEGMSRCHACTDGAQESEGLGEREKDAETVIIDELGVGRL